jgi:sporadic carbohydrate cluster protein (TIGR04323 family)
MVNELDRYEGLLATSMFMMPKRGERRRRIYDAIFAQGASLHFVLEDVVLRSSADLAPVEEILSIHNLLPSAPRLIPEGSAAADLGDEGPAAIA